MAVICSDIFELLKAFVNDEDIAISEKDLQKYADSFRIRIYYKKYMQAVNMPLAKIIVNYQNFVYNIARTLKGTRLTAEEKGRLELAFKIEVGSTNADGDLWDKFKEVLKIVPDKDKKYCVITFLVCLFGSWNYNNYLDRMDKMNERQVVISTIDKLEKYNHSIANIIQKTDRKNLKYLADFGDKVEYQGVEYTPEELRQIRDIKYPKKGKEDKIETITGLYRITDINIEKSIITAVSDDEKSILRMAYSDEFKAKINEYSQKFESAIRDGSKRFYIKAIQAGANKVYLIEITDKIELQNKRG